MAAASSRDDAGGIGGRNVAATGRLGRTRPAALVATLLFAHARPCGGRCRACRRGHRPTADRLIGFRPANGRRPRRRVEDGTRSDLGQLVPHAGCVWGRQPHGGVLPDEHVLYGGQLERLRLLLHRRSVGQGCTSGLQLAARHLGFSVSSCMAVGGGGSTYRFSNGRWSIGPSLPHAIALFSVSCPSSSFCMAVGRGTRAYTYANGTWSATKKLPHNTLPGEPPHPYCVDQITAVGVSCTSSSFCVVVGTQRAWIYTDGNWSSGVVQAVRDSGFWSISCVSPSFRVGAGNGAFTYSRRQPMDISFLSYNHLLHGAQRASRREPILGRSMESSRPSRRWGGSKRVVPHAVVLYSGHRQWLLGLQSVIVTLDPATTPCR